MSDARHLSKFHHQNERNTASSYIGFCKMIHSEPNTHIISILNSYTKSYGNNKLNDLIKVSIANKTPIAQFITDIYFECVLKYNLTINEFMEKSKFLSMLPKDNKPWQLIRKHLSEYLKYIYKPIHQNMFENKDQIFKHNKSRVLYYTSIIHENLYILNKLCQIDMIFMPQRDDINRAYFDKLGVKYEELRNIKKEYIKKMMRYFSSELFDTTFNNKRCIILIMESNDIICNDTVYIFEPLENNILPPEIQRYTEMACIWNTKSNLNILPNLAINSSNALCLSFHRQCIYKNKKHLKNKNAQIYTKSIVTERVYLSCGSYGARVFKRNLNDMISPFCITETQQDHINDVILNWEDEINNHEFKDHQYDIFVNTYFADLKLVKPDINIYGIEQLNDENTWSKLLYQYVINDTISSISTVREYMYTPTPIQYYHKLNNIISVYYKSMNIEYNDKFLTYIYENELEDFPLNENLGLNVDIDDCVLLEFDECFPLIHHSMDRTKFVFEFLQNSYLYGTPFLS